ncbi:MAG TPA: BT4734/BF3469 family protein [Bacteroidales bacterium]|nr:BT4734/BF3469 family protein [Bacteroidales bacterium]
MIVTEFINFNKDVAQLPITSVLEAIQSGRCRPEVRLLRKLLTDGNDAEYKKQKRFLPAFTPSASFSGGRTLKHLQQYNALIILDIDKLNPECLEKIVAQISEISFTYACFRSPSNQGVKILVRTDAEQSLHLQTFEAVKNLYESILQVPIDPSGKDITRLCFYSWDTDLYFNPSAEVFRLSLHNCHASSPVTEALEVTKTQFPDLVEGPVSSLTQNHCHAELIEARPSNDLTPPVIEALEVTTPSVAEPLEVPDIPILTALLETRNIDITTDYNSWLNIGFALADALKEAGRDYFHRISRISPLYNAADCDKQYNNCLKSSRSGITAKTLFYIAKQHGIDISECKAPVPEAVPNTKPDPPGTDEPKKKKRSNPFDKIEKFLSANYSLRYNIVTAKLEIAPHGSSQFEPMTDYLENSIFRNLHKNNVPVSMAKLRSILQSDFCDRYDPFLDYFTKLQPCDNQTDFIQQLAETVETTDNTFWHYCFKKWIVAVVASLLDPAVVNHTAIIFSGAQGIG